MGGNVHSTVLDPRNGKVAKRFKEKKNLKNVQLIAKLPGEGTIQYWSANASTRKGNSVNVIAMCVPENAQMKEQTHFSALAGDLAILPKHKNIVDVLGISITDVPYYIYFEHLQGGNLKDFLHRNCQQSHTPCIGDSNTLQLSRFSLDIVDGMMFLSQRDYCHPALCTRKILLNEKGTCKLYDFLPKTMSTDRITQIFKKPHPPVAWLSPEAIFLGQYTDKSEVWNFAVLLWEIYSFGKTPYEGLSCDEIEQEIRANRNLEQPLSCPGAIFGMMLASWNTSMTKRPDLSDWRQKLESISPETSNSTSLISQSVEPSDNNSECYDYKEQFNVCYEARS